MKLNKILSLSLALLSASSLFATEVEFQAVAGKNYVDSDEKPQYVNSTNLGVRSNIFMNKNNAIQIAYDRVKDVDNTVDFHRYSVNYLFEDRKDNNTKLHPFILAGAGYEDGTNENQTFLNAGVGASFELDNKLSLIAEVKAIKKRDLNINVNTNIGLGIMLGNEPDNSSACCNPCAKDEPVIIKPAAVVAAEPEVIEADCQIDEKIKSVR